MTTEADKMLDAAKDKMKEALVHLNKVVMDEVDGSRSYNAVYRNKILSAHSTLISLRDDLE